MLTFEHRTKDELRAHRPIHFEHMFIWCPFLDPHSITQHSKIALYSRRANSIRRAIASRDLKCINCSSHFDCCGGPTTLTTTRFEGKCSCVDKINAIKSPPLTCQMRDKIMKIKINVRSPMSAFHMYNK